jgi:hypothetical protein
LCGPCRPPWCGRGAEPESGCRGAASPDRGFEVESPRGGRGAKSPRGLRGAHLLRDGRAVGVALRARGVRSAFRARRVRVAFTLRCRLGAIRPPRAAVRRRRTRSGVVAVRPARLGVRAVVECVAIPVRTAFAEAFAVGPIGPIAARGETALAAETTATRLAVRAAMARTVATAVCPGRRSRTRVRARLGQRALDLGAPMREVGRQLAARQLRAREALDVAQQLAFRCRRQRRCMAGRFRTRGAADAVDVVLRRMAGGRSSRRGTIPTTSMPRAAMSVATSTRYAPARKPSSACLRCACDARRGCRAALMPTRASVFATLVGAVLACA